MAEGTALKLDGTFTLNNNINIAGDPIFDVTSGNTVNVAGVISDAPSPAPPGILEKLGGGTLVLSGANTYSGGTVISAGILQVTNNSSVGTGTVTLDGGTFRADGASDLTFTNNFAINAPGGTIDNNLTVLTLSGNITDSSASPGVLTFTGGSGFGGTTILSGNNGYSGGTAVLATTVQVSDGSSLGTGAVTLDWGTIQSNGTDVTLNNKIVLANTISLGGFTGGFLDANGARLTIAGNISGAGTLETQDSAPAGNSAVVLLGTNTYTGGTTICGCSTLQLGDATHTASILGAVINDGGVFRIVNADTSGITSITNEFGGVTIFRNSTTASTMTIDNVTGARSSSGRPLRPATRRSTTVSAAARASSTTALPAMRPSTTSAGSGSASSNSTGSAAAAARPSTMQASPLSCSTTRRRWRTPGSSTATTVR